MEKQPAKKPAEKPIITKENKSSLGKRKNSKPLEDNPDTFDNLDSVMSESRKKIQKLTHSNTIDGESVENMKSELMRQPTFVQPMACVSGYSHTITLSYDGTAHSFGRNNKGQLGLGHNNDVSLPTPIPNLPQINMISCGWKFTVCVDHERFIWSL